MRGKARSTSFSARSIRDHPRLCGEKSNMPKMSFLEKGSPPPMRGKVLNQLLPQLPTRITPAYAGKR